MAIKNNHLIKKTKTKKELDSEQFEMYRELKELVKDHLINELEIISADEQEIIVQVRLKKGTNSIKKMFQDEYAGGYR